MGKYTPWLGLSTAELAIGLGSKTQGSEDSGLEVRSVGELACATERALPTASPAALQAAARLKIRVGTTGRVIAVSGLSDTNGLTSLVATLGVALATVDGSRVLVIDGNAAEPRLHNVFGVSRQPGILDLLEHKSDLEHATHQLEFHNLFFLPAGIASTPLAVLLSNPGAASVFNEIRRTYGYVIIDAGLVRSSSDSMLVASMSDGVVVAVAQGGSTRHEVLQFRQQLKQLNIPLFGLVLSKPAKEGPSSCKP